MSRGIPKKNEYHDDLGGLAGMVDATNEKPERNIKVESTRVLV